MEMLKTYYTQKYIFVYKPWAIQLIILLYVILFNIVYKKGYQSVDTFTGSVTSKVKGVGVSSNHSFVDVYDLVHPAEETNSLFIATHRSIVSGQHIGICTGMDTKGSPPATRTELCSEDNQCPVGVYTANGITTGKCIQNPYGDGRNYCQIEGWCPLEKNPQEDLIMDAANFTIFIRADGYFPNLLPHHRFSTYTGELKWNYNLFYLSDIIAAAMSHSDDPLPDPTPLHTPPKRLEFDPYYSIVDTGAVIMVDIIYECNLDYSTENCNPVFKFTRVDREDQESAGFNFREINTYYVNSVTSKENLRRDLKKYYGVKILFNVHGEGRRYDFMVLSVTIGSGIGLLAIASYLCDIILTSCIKERHVVNNYKYEFVPTNEVKQPIIIGTSTEMYAPNV